MRSSSLERNESGKLMRYFGEDLNIFFIPLFLLSVELPLIFLYFVLEGLGLLYLADVGSV